MAGGRLDRIFGDIAEQGLRLLDFRGAQARLALCGALGVAGAVLFAMALNLDNPWWAGISVISILQAEHRATARRAVDRMIGTAVGAAIGFVSAIFVAWHLPFMLACAVVAAFTIYAQERTNRSYAVLLGGVTALIVLFGAFENPHQALWLAVYRGLEVIAGIIVGALVSFVLLPTGGAGGEEPAKPGVWTRPIDVELILIAATGGIAVAAIPVLWTAMELPGLGQTPITVFIVMTALRTDPTLKALARLIGCCLGGLYGVVVIGLVADAFLPWLACLVFGLYLSCFLQHGRGEASYAGQQASIALILSIVVGPAASANMEPAINRFAGIVGGIVVVALITALLDPLRLYLTRRWTVKPPDAAPQTTAPSLTPAA
jgi:uncharacterized membrane protein YccC